MCVVSSVDGFGDRALKNGGAPPIHPFGTPFRAGARRAVLQKRRRGGPQPVLSTTFASNPRRRRLGSLRLPHTHLGRALPLPSAYRHSRRPHHTAHGARARAPTASAQHVPRHPHHTAHAARLALHTPPAWRCTRRPPSAAHGRPLAATACLCYISPQRRRSA